ncbi:universal stress protein [Tepidiforma flava]|uniref:Universal stress protein n=1 Tax=Tepidiforma flava TaxID=3004094 RepID=A0ABY7MA42_9CHLR|nr:universal stress protein [Tepidiforma flava]WBL37426.1 universal stress protein [Tepidiforma flava]
MNILVTTDGSERSLCILPHAARLAAAVGADLRLARVLDPRSDAAGVVAERLGAAVAEVRARWEEELRAALAAHGVPGEPLVVERRWGEDVPKAIRRAAADLGASLIAMASRGTGAIRHAVFGSVAMGVVGSAGVPVMTLTGCPPAPAREGPYHLLITSDGSPDARSIFPALAPLLQPGRVRVTLLEVAVMRALETEAEAKLRTLPALEALRPRLPAGLETAYHIPVVPPGAGIDTAIIEAARELGADAVASATHGHSARRHLIAGSTALGVARLSPVPVILAKSAPVE